MKTAPSNNLIEAAEDSPDEAMEITRGIIPYAPVLAFFMGLTGPFTVRLVGLMPVSELVLLLVVSYAVLHLVMVQALVAPLVRNRLFGLFMFAQGVALLGYIISDLYRESSPGDMARGWARMIFLALDLCGVALLFGSSRAAFPAYIIGLAASSVHAALFGALFGDYWKFGFGYPMTVLVFLLAPRGGRLLTILAGFGMAALHIFLDFRSMSFTSLLTTAGIGLTFFPPRLRGWLVAAVAALAIAAAPFVLNREVSDETKHRRSRSNAERSAMMEAAGGAFLKSPLLGQGSWFSNSDVMHRFAEIRTENALAAGVGGYSEDQAEEMAIHSQILVSLAEGGFFGGTFFLVYGAGLVWAVFHLVLRRVNDHRTGIYLLLTLCGVLNVCFSPFSGGARVDIAVAATLVLLLWLRRHEETEGRPV
jgi:hypothetical protein